MSIIYKATLQMRVCYRFYLDESTELTFSGKSFSMTNTISKTRCPALYGIISVSAEKVSLNDDKFRGNA